MNGKNTIFIVIFYALAPQTKQLTSSKSVMGENLQTKILVSNFDTPPPLNISKTFFFNFSFINIIIISNEIYLIKNNNFNKIICFIIVFFL